MLRTNFAQLSKAQQRYCIILAKYRPNRDPSGVVSSSFVRTLHHELLAARENGGEKIGWPRWVFVENKTGESEGLVPFASQEDIDNFTKVEQSPKKACATDEDVVQLKPERTLTDAEFEAELLAAGISF